MFIDDIPKNISCLTDTNDDYNKNCKSMILEISSMINLAQQCILVFHMSSLCQYAMDHAVDEQIKDAFETVDNGFSQINSMFQNKKLSGFSSNDERQYYEIKVIILCMSDVMKMILHLFKSNMNKKLKTIDNSITIQVNLRKVIYNSRKLSSSIFNIMTKNIENQNPRICNEKYTCVEDSNDMYYDNSEMSAPSEPSTLEKICENSRLSKVEVNTEEQIFRNKNFRTNESERPILEYFNSLFHG